MLKLQIIVGSTRPERSANPVKNWVVSGATAHGAFAVEVLDLVEWPLPMFVEGVATLGDIRNPTYSDPLVKRWNQKIAEADAYVMITPEYNHSISGVLKNAIDSVFASFAFRNKPAGFVGYSGGPVGGARAVEHLAQIAIEAELVPLRNAVLIANVRQAFAPDGAPTNPMSNVALGILLDDLVWWAKPLAKARAAGQLPPGVMRMMAARTAEVSK